MSKYQISIDSQYKADSTAVVSGLMFQSIQEHRHSNKRGNIAGSSNIGLCVECELCETCETCDACDTGGTCDLCNCVQIA